MCMEISGSEPTIVADSRMAHFMQQLRDSLSAPIQEYGPFAALLLLNFSLATVRNGGFNVSASWTHDQLRDHLTIGK